MTSANSGTTEQVVTKLQQIQQLAATASVSATPCSNAVGSDEQMQQKTGG